MSRNLIAFVILSFQFSFAGDYLVRLKSLPQGLRVFASQLQEQGVFITKSYELVPGLLRVQSEADAFVMLKNLPEVSYAEINHVRRPLVFGRSLFQQDEAAKPRPPIPPPTPRPVEWKKNSGDTRNFGLYQNRTKDIFEKRKFYGSEKVVIAVLDTGVDYTHRDLAANMWRNPGEIAGNGIDDDGNGFVDDVVGWDFFHHDNLPFDDYGHGTHVAGIAAAVGGDGVGIAGQCPRCSIMAIKFIGSDGSGTDADAIMGLEYAAKMGATVINSSWGSSEYSQALYDAFAETSRLGIINAVAAGNDGVDLGRQVPNAYPAEFQIPGLYSVAALYETNIRIPFWSNYGRPFVHFSMGGADVYSTIPGGKYTAMSGTSMASPNAAGILALMKSYRPKLSFDQITEILKKSTVADVDSISKVNFHGRPDMVDAFKLLDKIPAQ